MVKGWAHEARRRSTLPLLVGAAAIVGGCAQQFEDDPVGIHLCARDGEQGMNRALMQRISSWQMVVWGLQDVESVVWRRTWHGEGTLSAGGVNIDGAIPPGTAVSIHFQGYGEDFQLQDRLLAVAASGALELDGGETICLCTAAPEFYVQLCGNWDCSVYEDCQLLE